MTTSKIVKLTPTVDVFSITWNLHKRCNNDCMYCGDFFHDTTSPVRSLEDLQQHWTQVFEKTKHIELPYKIAFTGGEPVINKNFKPFIEWLTDNYSQYLSAIAVTSNGTASKKYYLELLSRVNYLTLSTHTESMDVDRFIDTVLACHEFSRNDPTKSFMINIMEEYWAVDIIKRLIDVCREHQVKYSINKLQHYRSGSREYPIFVINKQNVPRPDLPRTEENINRAHKIIQDYANLHTVPDDPYYNVEITYEDGNTQKTYATRLNFLGLNYFKNWKCYAGLRRISIASDASVYSGECNNQYLGSLLDNSFQPLSEPGTCLREKCSGNPDDIMINKHF